MVIRTTLNPLKKGLNPYKTDEVLFEQNVPGIYDFTPKADCLAETIFVGGGAAGIFNSSSNRSSAAAGSSASGCLVRVKLKAGQTYQITVGQGGERKGGLDHKGTGNPGGVSKITLAGQDLITAPGGLGGSVWWPNGSSAAPAPALCSFAESSDLFSAIDILMNRRGITGKTGTTSGGASVIDGTEYGHGGGAVNNGGGSSASNGKPGYVKIAYYSKPPKFKPNYSIIGAPTIENGIASGFSQISALMLSDIFNPVANPWEVGVKIKFRASNTIQGILISVASSSTAATESKGTVSAYGLQFHIGADNKPLLYLSSTGNSWNLCSALKGVTPLSDNTDYWFKLIFTGSEYVLYSSISGEFKGEEIIEATVTTSATIYPRYILIGCNGTNFNQPVTGSIDLKESYIKINGEIWWNCKK